MKKHKIFNETYYLSDEVDGTIDDYECDASFNEDRIEEKDGIISELKEAFEDLLDLCEEDNDLSGYRELLNKY